MESFIIKSHSMGEVLDVIAMKMAVDDDAGRALMAEEKARLPFEILYSDLTDYAQRRYLEWDRAATHRDMYYSNTPIACVIAQFNRNRGII